MVTTMAIAKINGERLLNIPCIENVKDRQNWDKVDEMFVDSSGFGAEDEPALTIKQFYEQVKAGLGYAVIEAGQFQVYVGVFEKK